MGTLNIYCNVYQRHEAVIWNESSRSISLMLGKQYIFPTTL